MVCVPTSKTCTMCGGCLARYAAIAAFRVSGYDPLCTAFTTYSLCDALNLLAISFTRSPSTAVIACQNWISVAAREVEGAPVRSTAAATRTLKAERVMKNLPGSADSVGHYSTRSRRAGDAGATRRLRPKLVRAIEMRAVGVELGVEPAGRPAEELRHALSDRLCAVLPLAAARADAGPP